MDIQAISSAEKRRYLELDALRGLAALLIVFFHFTMGRPEYNTFFKLGVTGVDLFFIISGFVIFMSLQMVSNGVSFIINRFSRLYPLYWSAVTFTFFLLIISCAKRGCLNLGSILLQYLANLTMFQFYFNIPDLDGPYWTMLVEMLFYIFMLFLFVKKITKYINLIGVGLCFLILYLIVFHFDSVFIKNVFKFIPLLQFFPLFLAGINFNMINTRNHKSLASYLIILFCFLCQIVMFPHVGRSYSCINSTEYSIMLFIYFLLFVLFVNGCLSFIVNKTTLFLGRISYAMYLTHQYLSIGYIIPLFSKFLGFNFWFVVFFINLPIVIFIATFLTLKIDTPYSKIVREKLYKLSEVSFKKQT